MRPTQVEPLTRFAKHATDSVELFLRRRTLYPAELRRQILVLFFDPIDEQKTAIRRKESYLLYDIRRAKSTAEFWNFPIQCTGSGNRFGGGMEKIFVLPDSEV